MLVSSSARSSAATQHRRCERLVTLLDLDVGVADAVGFVFKSLELSNREQLVGHVDDSASGPLARCWCPLVVPSSRVTEAGELVRKCYVGSHKKMRVLA